MDHMKKGEIYEGTVERVSFPNKGHVRVGGEDSEVIVKNTIPGQTVRFRINKRKAGRLEGQLLSVLQPSALETEDAGCSLFPQCGGCTYRTLPYAEQLKLKEGEIRSLIGQALIEGGQIRGDGSPDYEFEGIRPSPMEKGYRNKMEYAFGDMEKDGELTLGLHRKNSTYDILTADRCQIVHEDFNRILSCVLAFCRRQNRTYCHKISHEGYLRHLLVRRASVTGEILVDLVTTSQCPDGKDLNDSLKELCAQLRSLDLEGTLIGILHTVNDSIADIIRNDRTDLLYGRDYFYEELLGLRFRITPFSFFQTNSRGAEVLYSTAREFLGDVENQTVFDLYSGTGTIAQIIAPVAKKVVGVEIVEEAVAAARENARLNGLDNCRFLAGDVLKVLDEIPEKPDSIILDPPREGIHPKALPKIISYGVSRIIYISCKPTSLARDLPIFLTHGYRLERIACVDLFPATVHVETVALLTKTN
jgi:23S rRNA (uracil1939-C5)-methyltransferase